MALGCRRRHSGTLAKSVVEWLRKMNLGYGFVVSLRRSPVGAEHGHCCIERDLALRLKARLHPMRGLKRDRSASVVIRGHAFTQNLRRGHYELGVDARPGLTLAAAFDELALVV